MLSKQELLDGYKKIMGAAEAEEEVTKIMTQVDKNGSGEIDYSGKTYDNSIQIRIRIRIYQ